MAARKPPIVDQRQADLAKVDAEIARLDRQKADKKAALDADVRLHALDQNMDMQKRLGTEISTIGGLIDQLRDKKFKIEIGEAEAVVAPKPKAAPVQHRAWEIDDTLLRKKAPEYPSVARTGANHDKFSEGLLDLIEHLVAKTADDFRKKGFHPDTRIGLDFACNTMAISQAQFIWLGERCKALEARVAELEERPSVEYRGVWKADEKYKRGHLVTHQGSVWHCELAGSGIVPGNGAAGWRLAVKAGRDGKDASR